MKINKRVSGIIIATAAVIVIAVSVIIVFASINSRNVGRVFGLSAKKTACVEVEIDVYEDNDNRTAPKRELIVPDSAQTDELISALYKLPVRKSEDTLAGRGEYYVKVTKTDNAVIWFTVQNGDVLISGYDICACT